MKWVAGAFVAGELPDPPADGVWPFETMRAVGGRLPLWERHLRRWRDACARWHPGGAEPAGLAAAARELLVRNGHGDGVLRLALVPAAGGAGVVELSSRQRRTDGVVTLLPVVTRPPEAGRAGDKLAPRTAYDQALAEARAGGADDGVLLGPDGAVLESSRCNLWLLLDGVWVTPPPDGILPGIARAGLLAAAPRHGIAVAERRCDLADLHRAAALMVCNAAQGPQPAWLLGHRTAVPAATPGHPFGPVWQQMLATGDTG